MPQIFEIFPSICAEAQIKDPDANINNPDAHMIHRLAGKVVKGFKYDSHVRLAHQVDPETGEEQRQVAVVQLEATRRVNPKVRKRLLEMRQSLCAMCVQKVRGNCLGIEVDDDASGEHPNKDYQQVYKPRLIDPKSN
jgi:hypothetical protein